MNIYFCAKHDLRLACENGFIDLKKDEIAFISASLNQKFEVVPKDKSLGSYQVDNSQAHNLFDGNKLIELSPCYTFCPRETKKKIVCYKSEYGLIEYGNSYAQFHIQNQSFFLDEEINGVDTSVIKISGKEVLLVKFDLVGCEYCYLIDDNELVFEGKIKEINVGTEKISLLKSGNNIYGQNLVFEYNVKEKTKNQFLVYLDERKVCEKLDIRYLFLDAIMIRNYGLCKKCLSENLNIEEDDLFEFFKEFDSYYFIEQSCILEKNNEVQKIVNFVVQNNKIIDILD